MCCLDSWLYLNAIHCKELGVTGNSLALYKCLDGGFPSGTLPYTPTMHDVVETLKRCVTHDDVNINAVKVHPSDQSDGLIIEQPRFLHFSPSNLLLLGTVCKVSQQRNKSALRFNHHIIDVHRAVSYKKH